MMPYMVQAPRGQEEVAAAHSNEASGDSNILRYINTLTSHQTNAKQQRMDRYLQQVKHQPTQDEVVKPPRFSVAKAPHKEVSMATGTSQSVARKKQKELVKQGKSVGRKSSREKRQYEGEQNYQQRKKPKRAPREQKKTAVKEMDRFWFNGANGAWPQNRSQGIATEDSEVPHLRTGLPAGNKRVQLGKLRQTQLQGWQRREDTSQTTKSKYCHQVGFEPVQMPTQLSPKVFTASTDEDPHCNSLQSANFLSAEEMLQDRKDAAPGDEVFVPAYDPLNSIMEFVFF